MASTVTERICSAPGAKVPDKGATLVMKLEGGVKRIAKSSRIKGALKTTWAPSVPSAFSIPIVASDEKSAVSTSS